MSHPTGVPCHPQGAAVTSLGLLTRSWLTPHLPQRLEAQIQHGILPHRCLLAAGVDGKLESSGAAAGATCPPLSVPACHRLLRNRDIAAASPGAARAEKKKRKRKKNKEKTFEIEIKNTEKNEQEHKLKYNRSITK